MMPNIFVKTLRRRLLLTSLGHTQTIKTSMIFFCSWTGCVFRCHCLHFFKFWVKSRTFLKDIKSRCRIECKSERYNAQVFVSTILFLERRISMIWTITHHAMKGCGLRKFDKNSSTKKKDSLWGSKKTYTSDTEKWICPKIPFAYFHPYTLCCQFNSISIYCSQ